MRYPPHRQAPEYLDMPGQDPGELRRLLREIRRTNRWFGGRRLVLRYLDAFLPQISGRPVTVLDVATAGADIPCVLVDQARIRGVPVRVTAVDISADVLGLARLEVAAYPGITLARADARALPFADRAFDIVFCGLTLHHVTRDEAAQVLREIDRVAREAFVVSDIVRSWAAYAGAWLDTRLLARSRLARHDGPLSVLRSFTPAELRDVAVRAGIRGVELHAHPMFRLALVRAPAGGRA